MAEAVKIDEEQRRYLLEIYESLIFLDDEETLNKFKCINCGHIAIRHNVANCKHIFCSTCMKQLFQEMCPKCENVEIVEVSRDGQFEIGMLALRVECRYNLHGCQESISLHQYQDHEAKCKCSTKALLPKLYSGPGQIEKLKEIDDNINQINNTINALRKDVISNNEIYKSLSNLCDKVENINNDMKQLKSTSQENENLKTTIQENQKLRTTCDALEKKIRQLQSDMEVRKETEQKTKSNACEQCLKLQVPTDIDEEDMLNQGATFVWKITGFKEKWQSLKNQGLPIMSEKFRDKEFGFEFQVICRLIRPNIVIELGWSNVNSFIYSHSRKFTLIDQSDHDKSHLSFTDTPLFMKNTFRYMKSKFFHDQRLAPITVLENRFDAYVKDDAILMNISFIPLALTYQVPTRNFKQRNISLANQQLFQEETG